VSRPRQIRLAIAVIAVVGWLACAAGDSPFRWRRAWVPGGDIHILDPSTDGLMRVWIDRLSTRPYSRSCRRPGWGILGGRLSGRRWLREERRRSRGNEPQRHGTHRSSRSSVPTRKVCEFFEGKPVLPPPRGARAAPSGSTLHVTGRKATTTWSSPPRRPPPQPRLVPQPGRANPICSDRGRHRRRLRDGRVPALRA